MISLRKSVLFSLSLLSGELSFRTSSTKLTASCCCIAYIARCSYYKATNFVYGSTSALSNPSNGAPLEGKFGFYDVTGTPFASLNWNFVTGLVHEKTITGLPLTYIFNPLCYSRFNFIVLSAYKHASRVVSSSQTAFREYVLEMCAFLHLVQVH